MVKLAKTLVFMLLFSFLSLFLFDYSKVRYIDGELLPYVLWFEEMTGLMVDYPVELGDSLSFRKKRKDGRKVLGYCMPFPGFFKHILISEKWWKNASYYAKEELVLHELGHCSLYGVMPPKC